MNKINEAFFLSKCEKKIATFETDVGPEIFFLIWPDLFVWFFFFYLASPFSVIVRLI